MDLCHELLTPECEAALLRQACAGDLQARDELVVKNQRLVFKYAARYFHCGIGGDQDLEDLVQWGNIGLLRAIVKWDPSRGVRFSTYAVNWIKESIYRRGLLSGNPYKLSYRDSTRMSNIRKVRSDLVQRMGREPSAAEIAECIGLDLKFVEGSLLIMDGTIRLDKSETKINLSGEETQQTVAELQPDTALSPEECAERSSVVNAVLAAVGTLPEQEAEIVRRRHLSDPPEPYTVIARDMGVSWQYVSQLEQQAMAQLRAHFGA